MVTNILLALLTSICSVGLTLLIQMLRNFSKKFELFEDRISSVILNENSSSKDIEKLIEIKDTHSERLDEHGKIIQEHSIRIAEHTQIIKNL